ncbi:MAG: hypothetical protein ACM3H8_13275, partial [Sphingobacteriales bacterium]
LCLVFKIYQQGYRQKDYVERNDSIDSLDETKIGIDKTNLIFIIISLDIATFNKFIQACWRSA